MLPHDTEELLDLCQNQIRDLTRLKIVALWMVWLLAGSTALSLGLALTTDSLTNFLIAIAGGLANAWVIRDGVLPLSDGLAIIKEEISAIETMHAT